MKNRLKSILIISILSIFIYSVPLHSYADTELLDTALGRISQEKTEAVTNGLALAGENQSNLINALISIPDEWIPGAVYLIENLPLEDLTAITEDLFVDTLRDAYFARNHFPWAAEYSEEIFLQYVLPPRVSQEPLEPWREYFLKELQPLVDGIESMSEAEDIAFDWAGKLAIFQQTQSRDQGPFETIAGGYGRCEELMILYIDALRAIGIPARQAWTPYWTYQDNNHAWTEIISEDGSWHDREGWIGTPTKRSVFVFSVPFGIPENPDVKLYKKNDVSGARYSIINSIGNYRDTATLRVKVVDISGKPVPESSVNISIYNWGALRIIGTGKTDENGIWEVQAGRADFFISAGDQNRGACMPVIFSDGSKNDEIIEITLVLGLGIETIQSDFWLRYPLPVEEAQE